MKLAQA